VPSYHRAELIFATRERRAAREKPEERVVRDEPFTAMLGEQPESAAINTSKREDKAQN